MKRVLAVAVVAALAGCVPGQRPPPPNAAAAPPASWRDDQAGYGKIDPKWWRSFGDPALDALEEAALTRNTDILAAAARVEQARAQARIARAALLPTLDVGGSALQDRTAGHDVQTLAATVTASWELDLFGRLGSLRDAARQQFVASQADRDAIMLSVSRSVAQAYFDLLSFDEQVLLTQETAKSRLETLRRTEDRAQAGYNSRFEYLQARGEHESILAQLPRQLLAVRTQENALAILVGDLPQTIARAPGISSFRTPVVPATLPSELVRRRPDIARAEYLLAAADSTIGARRADFLPRLTLGSDFGQIGGSLSSFDPATIWSIGGSILAPLFRGGALRANLDAAVAQRDEAAYAYRATVLAAFEEVENALGGQLRYGQQVDTLSRRITTATQSLAIAQDRYDEGYSDFLSLLDAQRQLFLTRQAQISAQADRLGNVATLATALGGGWNSRPPSSPVDGATPRPTELPIWIAPSSLPHSAVPSARPRWHANHVVPKPERRSFQVDR